MTARRVSSAAEAAAYINTSDSVAVGLGPAHPGGFLHALGDRDDWEDLQLFRALLTDLYAVFMKEAVHYRSGFFGPAERFLRDSGADIQYVPADFRRFGPIVEQLAPRVMVTAVSAPDADGYCSLSLHAGATRFWPDRQDVQNMRALCQAEVPRQGVSKVRPDERSLDSRSRLGHQSQVAGMP